MKDLKRVGKRCVLAVAALLVVACAPRVSENLPEQEQTLQVAAADLPRAVDLKHEPYGWDNLYGSKEVPAMWWEREPRDPQAGETVDIHIAAIGEAREDDVWIAYTKNGEAMPEVSCSRIANRAAGETDAIQYRGRLGGFALGDTIVYTIYAGENGTPDRCLGPFSFTVAAWVDAELQCISSVTTAKTRIEASAAGLPFALDAAWHQSGAMQLTVSAVPAPAQERTDLRSATLDNGTFRYTFSLDGSPLRLETADGERFALCEQRGIAVLTDGTRIHAVRLSVQAGAQEGYYGFGMRYDALNQRGKTVDIYCVNWYTDQRGESYTPVPYYFVPDTYGLYVDSTYYARFSMDDERAGACVIEAYTGGEADAAVPFYLFSGTNETISGQYADVAGHAVLPPAWAFGPWISANEWNRQSEVLEQLEQTLANEISTSVIVLEAWSDEETFYTFNDSVFVPGDGDYVPAYADFDFTGRWPDPKGMVEQLHEHGIRVLLWQIPVLKSSAYATVQSMRDQRYAITNGYVLTDGTGTPYRLPAGTWFGNSLLVDFTNPEAVAWFLGKRRYLLEELGVDGFKTDGGEFIWGRNVTAADGRTGDELRNAYPDLYAQAYFDYSRAIRSDAITFSRSGGSGMQLHPVCWVGDQTSTQRAFEDAIRAQLSASMSGIPFVAWDIAGFSGDIPATELYVRSVAQAAFSPIMQVHSETSGDPVPSQARTPWNMAARKGNDTCLSVYRYYANLRMNLLPYIYSEAKYASEHGVPLMQSMAYAFADSSEAAAYEFQYLLGRDLLVAPVTDIVRGRVEVYIPEGVWYGLFDGKAYAAGIYNITCEEDEIPVFVRQGAIIPANLGEDGVLGSYVGNDAGCYRRLTFLCYPGADTATWYDHVAGREVALTVDDDGVLHADTAHPYTVRREGQS